MARRTNLTPWRARLWLFGKTAEGVTAVEFALTAPVFLGFLFGLMELGRAMLTQGMLTYAVQEGARFAVAHAGSTAGQIQEVVIDSFAGIDASPVSLTVTPRENADGTSTISLAASYRFQPLAPIFGSSPFMLQASASAWR